MSEKLSHQSFSTGEEIAHAITHGLGVLGSLVALPLLIVRAAAVGDARLIVGVSVFGASMLVLYTASTMYHALTAQRAKFVFELLDHAAIYLLITGTYTPFLLVTLGGRWGWTLFAVVCVLAVVGIIYEVVFRRPWKWVSLALYLVLGWMAVIATQPLAAALPHNGLLLLGAGGLAYTFGAVFYAWRGFPYHHAVWHLFVLAGTTCHFFGVLWYIIPPATAAVR